MTVQHEAATQGVILTDTAAVKVSNLLAAEGREDLRLRIAVQPGGCSGLRYQLYFDERELKPTAGFPALKHDLERLFAALAEQDWSGL